MELADELPVARLSRVGLGDEVGRVVPAVVDQVELGQFPGLLLDPGVVEEVVLPGGRSRTTKECVVLRLVQERDRPGEEVVPRGRQLRADAFGRRVEAVVVRLAELGDLGVPVPERLDDRAPRLGHLLVALSSVRGEGEVVEVVVPHPLDRDLRSLVAGLRLRPEAVVAGHVGGEHQLDADHHYREDRQQDAHDPDREVDERTLVRHLLELSPVREEAPLVAPAALVLGSQLVELLGVGHRAQALQSSRLLSDQRVDARLASRSRPRDLLIAGALELGDALGSRLVEGQELSAFLGLQLLEVGDVLLLRHLERLVALADSGLRATLALVLQLLRGLLLLDQVGDLGLVRGVASHGGIADRLPRRLVVVDVLLAAGLGLAVAPVALALGLVDRLVVGGGLLGDRVRAQLIGCSDLLPFDPVCDLGVEGRQLERDGRGEGEGQGDEHAPADGREGPLRLARVGGEGRDVVDRDQGGDHEGEAEAGGPGAERHHEGGRPQTEVQDPLDRDAGGGAVDPALDRAVPQAALAVLAVHAQPAGLAQEATDPTVLVGLSRGWL